MGDSTQQNRHRLALDRQRTAWDLYATGKTQEEIASTLGVSQAAVSKMLARAENRVLEDIRGRVETHKARQTIRLEKIYAEAMAGWERSKADRTKKASRTKAGAGRDGGAREAFVQVEEQVGDPKYLETAMRAMADLRKLWGLDAPAKQVLVDERRPLGELSDGELMDEAREILGELGDRHEAPGVH